MFTRVVNYTGARDIDAGIRYISETAAPLLRQQNGFRGVTASADRARGVLGILSIWDTEADRDASEGSLAKARDEALQVVGGKVDVEHFEEVFSEMVGRPTIGSSLLIRRVSMEPAKVDENLAYFIREVAPQIKSQAGCLGLRHMINRETGEGIVGSVWADEPSMLAALDEGNKRRSVAEARGVVFGEESLRKVVFVDMPGGSS
jgi:heme-degrading monooxygenase HmoA